MKDNEINQAVAECCGWTNVRMDYANGSDTFKSFLGDKPGFVNSPPFYIGSRDAMASALATLSNDEWTTFCHEFCIRYDCIDRRNLSIIAALTFKVKDLAILFLKAKGKWRDAAELPTFNDRAETGNIKL